MFEEMTPVFTEKTLSPYDICELHGKNLKIFVGEDVVDGERTTVVFGSDIDSGVQYVLEVRKTEEKESVVTDEEVFEIAGGTWRKDMGVYKMVQEEPVAYISHTSEGDILGWERQFDAPSHTPLYAAPQPAPDVSVLVEALQAISRNELDAQRAQHIAAEALATHHKGDKS